MHARHCAAQSSSSRARSDCALRREAIGYRDFNDCSVQNGDRLRDSDARSSRLDPRADRQCITIGAIQRRVGTLRHARNCIWLLGTFRRERWRFVRQRPDNLTRSCFNEHSELLAEILNVCRRHSRNDSHPRVQLPRMCSEHTGREFQLNLRHEAERQKSTDTCYHRRVRLLLVLFGRRFPSVQPGRPFAVHHRFCAIHIGDQSVGRPSRIYAHRAPGFATTSRFRSDDHSRRRSCTRLRTFPLRDPPLGSWQGGSRHG